MTKPESDWTPGEAGVFVAMILTLQSLVHGISDKAEREALATAHGANIDKLSYRDNSDLEASATLRTVAHKTIGRIYGGSK